MNINTEVKENLVGSNVSRFVAFMRAERKVGNIASCLFVYLTTARLFGFLGRRFDRRYLKFAFRLKHDDALHGIVRLPSGMIRSPRNAGGVFIRNQFVTIRNRQTGAFVVRKAVGCGSNYNLSGYSFATDYDAFEALAISSMGKEKVYDLEIRASHYLEREHFLCFQDFDTSSREARKNNWLMLGVGAPIVSFMYSLVMSIF